MTDHEEDLLELAGTHGWRAILAESTEYLKQFEGIVLAPATTEFDFVRKEVAAGVIRELKRFFVGIEQTMDNLANQRKRA